MASANEKRRYNVTSSLFGWAYTQNVSCVSVPFDVIVFALIEAIPLVPNLIWCGRQVFAFI